MAKQTERRPTRTVTIYRDDSTVPVVYSDTKTTFWTAGNTILTIARWKYPDGDEHYYTHWPRERFAWFKDEPQDDETEGETK